MIINGQHLREDLRVDADLCIVGTGMSGSSLLRELASLPLKIVVIEAGDANCVRATLEAEMIGRAFALPRTRAVQLGGTINLWHGVCAPLDPIDFEVRPWIADSGWPISREQLDPFYARASSLLSIPEHEYFQEQKLPPAASDRLADIQVDETIVARKLFQVSAAPKKLRRMLEDDLQGSDRIQCFTNSCAVELLTSESDRDVEQLKVITASQRTLTVRARSYVLCAGGLETPRLLLNSTGRNRTGVGNEQDLVGRYLADHPQGNLCQIQFRTPQRAALYSDLRLGETVIRTGLVFCDDVQRRHAMPNHTFYLRPSFKRSLCDDTERIKRACCAVASGKPTMAELGLVIKHPVVAGRLFAYKRTLKVKYRYADMFCQTDQVPNPDSRVQLSDTTDSFGYRLARVNWAPTQQDFESMETTFRLLNQALAKGPYQMVHRLQDLNWNACMTSAAHHLGTARMGASPAKAVVDEKLQVFGKRNLFVCDASVFPTAGNANPSLTICALAIRLADHLKQQTAVDSHAASATH